MAGTEAGDSRIRDRLLMTLFIAALAHGMIILGLTFGGTAARHGAGARGLDVLLTSDELPAAEHNDTATYLAQRSQAGAGNTARRAPLHNRAAPAGGPGLAGQDHGLPGGPESSGGRRADERVIATRASNPDVRYFGTADSADPAADEARLATPAGPEQVVDDTGPVLLRGPRRDLALAPDSRRYAYAEYLVDWTRRVERIGTLNFPAAARRPGVTASPVVRMVIGADGRLRSARILRSSGYPDLDQAALAILRLASPFDPFPPAMATRTRTLGFAYEFRFTGGRMAGVAQAAPP